QRCQVRPGGEVIRIDEERCIQGGRRESDPSVALRPDEGDTDGETLVGLDLSCPHCGSREQSVRVGTLGVSRASKEEMTPGSGSWRYRGLRLRDEGHDEGMVLKIPADPGQAADYGDPVATKLTRIADTREHEQAG